VLKFWIIHVIGLGMVDMGSPACCVHIRLLWCLKVVPGKPALQVTPLPGYKSTPPHPKVTVRVTCNTQCIPGRTMSHTRRSTL
jgi:hypothetical protein